MDSLTGIRRGGRLAKFVCGGAAAFGVCATSVALAEPPTFTGVGDLSGGSFHSAALGVSADGRVVVGESIGAPGLDAFRWTAADGMQSIGDLPFGSHFARALGVSADGAVISGYGTTNSGRVPFRWTASDGMRSLIPPSPPGPPIFSYAAGVSEDGSVLVGYHGFRAFRWTAAGGVQFLMNAQSVAQAVDAAGEVVVGQVVLESGTQAFRWTEEGGVQGLGALPRGSVSSVAYGVSGDGLVVVGSSSTGSGTRAFRWNVEEGMQGLDELAGGSVQGVAYAANRDGSTVVGAWSVEGGTRAFVWTPHRGVVDLREYLVFIGVDSLEGWTLTEARGVSADGLTIVGTGVNPAGASEGWVAHLGAPIACGADFNRNGAVDTADFFEFVTAFFEGQLSADVNHDAFVNSQDFFVFLAAMFVGC